MYNTLRIESFDVLAICNIKGANRLNELYVFDEFVDLSPQMSNSLECELVEMGIQRRYSVSTHHSGWSQ